MLSVYWCFLLQICLHIANLCYVVGIIADVILTMYKKLGSNRLMWISLFPFPTLLLFLLQSPKHWRRYFPVALFHIVVRYSQVTVNDLINYYALVGGALRSCVCVCVCLSVCKSFTRISLQRLKTKR